jgi:hypothetical protein
MEQSERWFDSLTPHRLAAGTYGLVIGAAVLVAAGGSRSLSVTLTEVAVSLVVYWLAEAYAEVLGHHAAGERLGLAGVGHLLRQGLAMIELSLLPVLALVIGYAAGLSLRSATTVAVALTAVLLTGLGLLAGVRFERSVAARIGTAVGAGLVGVLMVALKVSLH